ncbi:hypothetical protein TIFTF001_005965 [Ficus carica]|uniref:TIR domain-containing protein n=1 Tax=Ficus carica TaxID=3494 RepID=A0AA87ZKZ6_FICCA|nr:hypothetical protein TIFTF001_005965 [Ficus carica]
MERASWSSSSPSNSPRKGEVLLSFCDEEIGKSFASHLKSALNKKGIDTVRQDVEVIGRDLKCSVIIFSPNYPSSASRLDEVAKILHWKDTLGHKLIPVFYEVPPSEVGKQSGSFGEAFSLHGQDSRAPGWRRMLATVAKISGKHFENRNLSFYSCFPSSKLGVMFSSVLCVVVD